MIEEWPRGCLQLYTGEGKGKTTAAIGLAIRAAGAGMKVYMGQFLKSRETSELLALQRFTDTIVIEQFGSGEWVKEYSEEEAARAKTGLEAVRQILKSGNYRVVIADEILGTLRHGLLTVEELVGLVNDRPEMTELVFTGREAPHELIELADLVTQIRSVKHYYETGLPARRGIEF